MTSVSSVVRIELSRHAMLQTDLSNSTGGTIMARNVQDIRNIAVCGHGSSGKTTLVDQLLVKTGAVERPAQRRRRHQHLRLRRRGKAPQALDRIARRPLRSRRQALQPHRHARLPRPHRPDDRRPAGRRHGADHDRRPRRHQGQHPPRLAGSGQGRLGRILCITKLDTDKSTSRS